MNSSTFHQPIRKYESAEARGHEVTTRWIGGIPYEVAFWNNVYRWKHTRDGALAWSNLNREIKLDAFDAPSFLRGCSRPVVLDVGCGMSYAPGNFISGEDGLRLLHIEYIDPLASYFNKIKNRYRPDLPDIKFGMMEFLSAFYEADSASLVIIQNALDHSSDPLKGICEALAVVRVGGILYLNHHPNEAVTERYKGFHQYNIMNDSGRLIIWREESRIDVAERLEGFATVRVAETAEGHVVAVVEKTAPVPGHLLTDKADKRRLCEALMAQQRSTSGFASGLRPWLRFWKYNVIQFFVQALPWEQKMRLKRWLKR